MNNIIFEMSAATVWRNEVVLAKKCFPSVIDISNTACNTKIL
jgi:hypothetical protein